jgi:hypothetical protein
MTRSLCALLLLCAVSACHKSPPAGKNASASAAPQAAGRRGAGGEHRRGDAVGAPLEVVVNGKPVAAWTPAQIASAPGISMTNANGEQKQGFPLKALAQKLVGQKARIVALDSDDDRVAIDEKAWNDPSRVLVIKLSHRGEYKAHWVAGGVADDAFLKGVRRIEVVQ